MSAYVSAMRRFFIGLGAGLVLGYTAIRVREAIADRARPAPELASDPTAYGGVRRAFMLAGIARSLATLAATAYAVAPAIEPTNGSPESRARRIAIVAAGIVATTLLELPIDYMEGFVLERRYGLSKQTADAWIADHAKSLGLSLALTVPLVEALAFAIDRAPESWPLIATAGTLPLVILANVIAPTYIAPLFNTFEPLEGDFADRIRALAGRYGAGDATILRVDMSRQTEKANAYVTGLFGTKRIVIGDTLLDRFEERETLFVVAHELGHYVAADVWRGVALAMVSSAAIFFGSRQIARRDGESLATTTGLARLAYAMSLLGTLAGPVLAGFSRNRERAADRFAIAATSDASSGAAAFRRLRERNMAEDEQPAWMETLFSSHPSLRSRIAALEEAAASV
jgi:STE24 endopeptidase